MKQTMSDRMEPRIRYRRAQRLDRRRAKEEAANTEGLDYSPRGLRQHTVTDRDEH